MAYGDSYYDLWSRVSKELVNWETCGIAVTVGNELMNGVGNKTIMFGFAVLF